MDNKIIIKDSFTMPAVDDTINVIVSKSIGLTPECWIWNDSVGYLKVVKFSLYDNQVTLENVGRIENAKAGTLFPTCMEFLITAPAPIDLYNSMSTCLKADFNSPSVGNEALMSVESSYAISVDDQVIIDRTYRYLVTQVVNSTTLKVKNEGLGATGIIHVACNECTPVQVVNQLNCCPIPTGDLTSNTSVLTVVDGEEVLLAPSSITLDTDLSQYDNSVTQFIDVTGVPRGTLSSNSNLVSVTNGTNNVLDNISLDLDTDLSKYNNITSGYITLGDVPRGTLSSNETLLTVTNGTNNVLDNISLDLDTDLSKYDNSTSEFLASSDKKNLTSNTTVLTVTNGTGTTLENTSLTLDTDLSQYDNSSSNFLATSDKKDLTSTSPILTVTNGTGTALENTYLTLNTDLSQYDNSVSKFVSVGGLPSGDITSANSILTVTGGTGATLTNTLLTIDDDLSHYDNSTSGFITSSSLPTVNDAKLTIYQSDGVTPFVEFTANASSAVTATLPASGNTYTATLPISIDANNDISISQATTSTDGYLSSTDWNTFNSKASSLVYFEEALSGTTAVWKPKSGSATTYELGVNSVADTFSKAYIDELHIRGIVNDLGNATIRITSNTTLAPGGSSSGGTLNSVNLGGSDYPFYEGWITYVKTNELKTVSGSNISVKTNLVPSGSFDLGNSNNYWNNAYINNLYANNMGNYVLVTKQEMTFDFSAGGGTIPSDYTFLPGHYYSTYSTNTYTFSNVFSQPVHLEIMFNLNKFRLNISSGTGNNATYELHLWWESKLYNTGGTVPGTWTSHQSFTAYCQAPSAASHACTYSLANYASGEINIPSGNTVQIRLLFYFALISAQGTVKTYSGWGPETNAKILGWLTN